MRQGSIIILLLILCAGASLANASADSSEGDRLWGQAVDFAKKGDTNFAFMNFDLLIRTCPGSPRIQAAHFSLGEYYFNEHNYRMATKEFSDFANTHTKDQESLIALAYLYKIAQLQGQKEAAEQCREKIATSHQTMFIFKDSKSFRYASALQHRYELILHIDKINVTIDEKPFVEISY